MDIETTIWYLLPFYASVNIGYIFPLSIIFYGKQWIKEDINESQSNCRAKPSDKQSEPYFQPEKNNLCSIHLNIMNLHTNLLDKEFEFSRSFSSLMICPEDIDDSSCLAKHCSVFRMSLLWQPYSFFKIIGKDSAKFTLEFVFIIF